MVSQVNWEDDIIWSLDEVKPNLQAQARAGWIPTGTTRTAHAYALQQEQLLQQLGMTTSLTLTLTKINKILTRKMPHFIQIVTFRIFFNRLKS